MSFNNNLSATQNYAWVEDYYFQKKLEAKAAYFNPATEYVKSPDGVMLRPQTIYVGEENGRPTWEWPVFDVARWREARSAYKSGRLNLDQAEYRAWLDSKWENAAAERAAIMKYGRQAAREYLQAAGGTITSGDSPAIAVVQLLGETMGRDERRFVLEQAVRRVATPNLTLSVDTWRGFVASANVGENVEAAVRKGEYLRDQYFLTKDVAHIEASDEAQMVSDRNVFNDHVQHAVFDLNRIKNQKIAVELETAPSDITGTDWFAKSAGVSTADPIREITQAGQIIFTNGGDPNTLASGSQAYRAFANNTAVKGTTTGAADSRFGSAIVTNLAGLPQFTWYVDDLKSQDKVTVYDRSAVLLMQGPVKTAQYRIEDRGTDAFITRDYNLIKIIDPTRVRDIVGVTTYV